MARLTWTHTQELFKTFNSLNANNGINKVAPSLGQVGGALFDDITEGSRFANRLLGVGVIARNAMKEGGNWTDATNNYFLRDASKGWEYGNVRSSHVLGSGAGAFMIARAGMGAVRGATTDSAGNTDLAGIPFF